MTVLPSGHLALALTPPGNFETTGETTTTLADEADADMAAAVQEACMAMCRKPVGRRLLGSQTYPSRREDPDLKPKGKGKGGKGKKGVSSLGQWPDGHNDQSSGEKTNDEVAGLFVGAVSRHGR